LIRFCVHGLNNQGCPKGKVNCAPSVSSQLGRLT
jgi:hypothetical protein